MTVADIMLSAIRTQVCGAERTEYGEISEDAMRSLYTISKSHDMAHLVASELGAVGMLKKGDEMSAKFSKQQLLAIYRYERINYELEAVRATLEQLGVPFIALKGSAIRKYYPEPWMRTSCDIDILVHEYDLERCTERLGTALGYRSERKGPHDVSLYSPGGVHIELHYDLVEDGRANNSARVLRKAWNYVSPIKLGAHENVFSDEMYYLYHIAHMAKHFENGGCGVRPLLDLWILEHKVEHDSEKRDSMLESCGLLTFAKAVRALSEVWFGGKAHDELTRQTEAYILHGGVYGCTDNRVVLQQNKKGSKLKYAISRIFLPYDALKYQYPVLQKRRWLMPFMQVRRWCKLVFCGGLRRSLRELNINSKTSKEQMDSTKAFLEEIGL